jgi:hypothetical protein
VPLDPSFWIEEPEPFDWKSLRHLAKTISFPPFDSRQADMVTTIHNPDKHRPLVWTNLKNRSPDDRIKAILDKKMATVKTLVNTVDEHGRVVPLIVSGKLLDRLLAKAKGDPDAP